MLVVGVRASKTEHGLLSDTLGGYG
jgi:hypothetical protein